MQKLVPPLTRRIYRLSLLLWVVLAIPVSASTVDIFHLPNGSSSTLDKTIIGTVKDNTGTTLPGVNVLEKGSTNGTITDAEGKFKLTVSNENAILAFSFIGYTPKEVTVGSQSSIELILEQDTRLLNEVIVTALGMKREEKSLGYSVQKVSGSTLQTVKGVNLATSLTGKVSGLWVRNSTEFNEAPSLSLRGETPLLVIDGVPYGNISLKNLNQDDIESIDVLKGPTAAALYGSRGGSGAVIVTTKRSGKGKGLSVSVNSNNMFNAGFLMLPENQHSYSAGLGSAYSPTDYIWGAKLDNGTMANQWNPISKKMEVSELRSVGKDNFKDFLVPGMISNNNISVAQTGENGSFRVSMSHIYNKGQYPNLKSNNTTFNASGEMRVGNKFTLNSQVGYNRLTAPQIAGSGYDAQGYIYNIIMWMGPEYNLASYKDNYWLTPNVKQNWLYNAWYDNPYMMAYEKLNGIEENKVNASFTATLDLFEGAKILVRPGFDLYQNNETRRNPPGILSTRGWDASGLYSIAKRNGYSFNGDAFMTYNKTIGKLGIDVLAGGTLYKFDNNYLYSSTRSGLIIPGYYSLNNSVERPNVSVVDPNTDASNPRFRKQVNSLLGKLSLAYNNTFFLDVTGRNDWSSTMPANTNSYFYPSAGASVVVSEFFQTLPSWLDFWKVRGSWTLAKSDLRPYTTNNTYSTSTGVWNGLNTASYPGTILNASNVIAETNRTWEIGTAAYFLKKRFKLDVAYFNKYNYNIQTSADISQASGFNRTLINIDQTLVRKGMEITLDAMILKKGDWQWDATANWSYNHRYFKALDPKFSAKNNWTKEGGRTDTYTEATWLKDPQGNLIHQANGLTQASTYNSLYGYQDPKFIWGLSNTVRYKQFTFNAAFDGRVGGLLYNYSSSKMWDTGAHPDSDNQWRYDEVVNKNKSYVGQGVVVTSGAVVFDNFGNITSDTREYATNTTKVSYETYARRYGDGTRGATNATFFKLRELSLGYALPPAVAKYIGAKSASISFTGQNVWMWTKDFRFADPDKANDSQLSSPSVRYVGGNIQLTF